MFASSNLQNLLFELANNLPELLKQTDPSSRIHKQLVRLVLNLRWYTILTMQYRTSVIMLRNETKRGVKKETNQQKA